MGEGRGGGGVRGIKSQNRQMETKKIKVEANGKRTEMTF